MLQFMVASLPTSTNGGNMTDVQFLAMFLSGIAAFGVNLIAIAIGLFKLGGAVATFKAIGQQQAYEINQLKVAVASVATLMADNSLLTHRVETVEHRLNHMDKLVDDIRRGEGAILPLFRSAYEAPPQGSPQQPPNSSSR
jgi:hypothetical protein